jgi:hypothetical protein
MTTSTIDLTFDVKALAFIDVDKFYPDLSSFIFRFYLEGL